MPDATYEDFCALATALITGESPILPQPEWGQDAAYIAYVIDGVVAKNKHLRKQVADLCEVYESRNQYDGGTWGAAIDIAVSLARSSLDQGDSP